MLGWSIGSTWAFVNTVQAHAYTLTGIHGVFTLIIYMIRCKKTDSFEKIGTLIVAVGATIMICDPNAKRIGEQVNIGASIACMVTNFPGAFFWLLNEYMFNIIDKPTLIFLEIVIVVFYLVPIAVTFNGATFDTTEDTGIFGLLDPKNLWLGFFWNAGVAGFWGFSGYIICMDFFSPLVVMNCLLLEPLISQNLGMMLKIDEAPGPMTWVGVVLIGVAINVIH